MGDLRHAITDWTFDFLNEVSGSLWGACIFEYLGHDPFRWMTQVLLHTTDAQHLFLFDGAFVFPWNLLEKLLDCRARFFSFLAIEALSSDPTILAN